MAKSPAAYDLAHIADSIGHIDTRLEDIRSTMVGALSRLTEAIGAQNEMLAEILGAARADPGPSPIGDHLAAVLAGLNENTDVIQDLAESITAMPAEIGKAISDAIPERARRS